MLQEVNQLVYLQNNTNLDWGCKWVKQVSYSNLDSKKSHLKLDR